MLCAEGYPASTGRMLQEERGCCKQSRDVASGGMLQAEGVHCKLIGSAASQRNAARGTQ